MHFFPSIVGVIPLVEAMLLKGVAVGTTLAFMMSIAAISLPELLILKKVMHWRALALFTGIVDNFNLVFNFLQIDGNIIVIANFFN
jgi:uncharacterized membrane protein YraQ (UPF0718 family)